MQTLQIQIRYEAAASEQLSKCNVSKVKAHVENLFFALKCPNLGGLSESNLELENRMVSVQYSTADCTPVSRSP